ncbi:MAG: beta-galactosidase [Clostridia bacterium]|nr:beta-galactosidase [Clostridia bacterium]
MDKIIKIDVKNTDNTVTENSSFGNKTIRVTNKCLIRNGKPWLPVMGEMHYSRVPEREWEKSLKIMKDGGIEIISSYVFWNHHESEKGKFRFDGNRNIKKFVQMCDDMGLYFFLRIGPWAHGEARHGGFPDWLVEECKEACRDMDIKWPEVSGVGTRRVVEPYMTCLKEYIKKICDELSDCRNIIGVQIENELTDAPEYMNKVREIVVENGMNVPLYTATAWGNARLENTNLLPIWGTYPEAPWERDSENALIQIDAGYKFQKERNSSLIGADILSGNKSNTICNADNAPYMTCELGPGNQITYHRRPLITEEDVYSVSVCKLGSGCNLLGYYVYRGGLNPTDEAKPLQESMASGYPNDYPIVTYDFQAPIGSDGQIRRSYFLFKELFDFCHSFGDIIAPMDSVLDENEQNEDVRWAVRTNGESGFLFVNNHSRSKKLKEQKNVEFNIETKNGNIAIPFEKIPSDATFFVPFGLNVKGINIKYSTAMLVKTEKDALIFRPIKGIEPAICLENGDVIKLSDEQEICGTKVIMRDTYYHKQSVGEKLEVKALLQNTLDFTQFEHLGLTDRTKEYKVNLKENMKYIKVSWQGNVAALYADGEFITDNYFYGEPWAVDVSDIADKDIIIKIQPINEKEILNTYFDVIPKTGNVIPEVEGFYDEYLYF